MPLVTPPPLTPPRPPVFPWLGAIAPVVASLVLFAVTRSPFALAFAALGPVTAVASMIDGRRAARRTAARERAAREAAIVALVSEVETEIDRIRRQTEIEAPSTRALVDLPRPTRPLDMSAARPVRLGLADIDSGIRLQINEPQDAELARTASVVPRAPFVLDASGGLGILGPSEMRAAFADTVRAQLRWRAGPRGEIPTVAHAATEERLSEHCRLLVELRGPREARVLRAPDLRDLREFRPDLLGALERAALAGGSSSAVAIPGTVDLCDLPTASTGVLAATFAVSADGPVRLDLVADGPHALVGGTTGSGKSELLVSWILALTAERSADEVGLVLFDFKGGAAFDVLADLPHVRSLVTDLDGAAIDRAMTALAAELRSRERSLRAAGARSAEEMPSLGRLVVVVDEFAALLAERRELHDLFVDIAARGRSLGVHLVLCTQRPAGVVRDSLAANCALRISLRVVDAMDSSAVVGDDSASRIPRSLPGRCVVAIHGDRPVEMQVATVSRQQVERMVVDRARDIEPARGAGWLPPLPSELALDLLPAVPRIGQIRLGLADIPEEASQPLAVWEPSRDGALAVIGAPGSGRSTAARTIAAETSGILVADRREPGAAGPGRSSRSAAEQLWDEAFSRSADALIVDDADALLERMESEQRMACVEALPAMFRRRGHRVALTLASPASPSGRAIAAVTSSTLALRMVNADDHRIHVGPGATSPRFDPHLQAGGGVWQGHRIQVASGSGAMRRPGPVPAVTPSSDRDLLLVTTRPEERIACLRARGYAVKDERERSSVAEVARDAVTVHVIDPLSWVSASGLWTLIGRVDTIYDRCHVADYRSVSRDREVPPVLDGLDRVWFVPAGGTPVRATLDLDPAGPAR